jgi:5-methylcytosine-specific restriction endonuclease McrA
MDVTGEEFTIDHIFPETRGGGDGFDNLCFCCFWCNVYKQAHIEGLDPRTKRLVPLFNPRTQRWDEHFRWSSTFTRVLGRTAVGRATVEVVRLNRPRLVRARKVWAHHGLHPPERASL